jgi:hypothetical protein
MYRVKGHSANKTCLIELHKELISFTQPAENLCFRPCLDGTTVHPSVSKFKAEHGATPMPRGDSNLTFHVMSTRRSELFV